MRFSNWILKFIKRHILILIFVMILIGYCFYCFYGWVYSTCIIYGVNSQEPKMIVRVLRHNDISNKQLDSNVIKRHNKLIYRINHHKINSKALKNYTKKYINTKYISHLSFRGYIAGDMYQGIFIVSLFYVFLFILFLTYFWEVHKKYFNFRFILIKFVELFIKQVLLSITLCSVILGLTDFIVIDASTRFSTLLTLRFVALTYTAFSVQTVIQCFSCNRDLKNNNRFKDQLNDIYIHANTNS